MKCSPTFFLILKGYNLQHICTLIFVNTPNKLFVLSCSTKEAEKEAERTPTSSTTETLLNNKTLFLNYICGQIIFNKNDNHTLILLINIIV